MPGLKITTLRDFHAAGWTLTAYCSRWPRCGHCGTLRVDNLVQRLGWDFDIYAGRDRLLGLLRCSVCGTRHPETILTRVEPPSWDGAHLTPAIMPYDEALRLSLEMRAAGRERNAEWERDRPPGGRVRKFGPGRR